MPSDRSSVPSAGRLSRLSGYLIAILAIASAAGLRRLLEHFSLWDAPILLLGTTVVLVAGYYGFGPGLLAAAAGAYLWTRFYSHAIQVNFFLLLLGGGIFAALGRVLVSTRRKSAQIQKTAIQQEKLIDLSHDAIIVRDRDSVILKWNAGAAATYGWTEAEALGKVTHSFFNTRFPSSTEEVTAKLNQDGFWEGELTHTARDGAQIVVESRQVLLRDEKGAPLRILEINREITPRKRAEEARQRSESRFHSLMDANVIGVAWGSPTGKIVEANAAFLKIMGFSRDDLAAGEVLWPPGATATPAPLERDVVRKDGSRLPVLLFAATPDPPGEDAVVLVVDLSARKMLEQKLQQKQKLETVGILAAGVAHDFNNLLTSIMMNTELALDGLPAGHDGRAMLKEVTHEAMRAAQLTGQLLAYAGKAGLVARPIDLGATLREAAANTLSQISRQVPIRFEFDAHLAPIEADRDQIQKLFTNLIVNGVEAIGDAPDGRIVISTARYELCGEDEHWEFGLGEIGAGAYALVRVQDNGCGMDSAILAKAFDPFFSTKFLGRGLGLSEAQGIARAHRGAIRFISAPGQGATLEVLLPMPAFRSQPVQ
jgi:PAS domain S-box-containing protein